MKLAESTRWDEIPYTEGIESLDDDRNEVRQLAKQNITAIQEENRLSYYFTRKEHFNYNVNALVAVKRTQFGISLELERQYFRPYKTIVRLPHVRWKVQKLDEAEGPNVKLTVAEHMKKWCSDFELISESGRPNVRSTNRRKTTRSVWNFSVVHNN